ncbi:phosphoribosylglycinamide formyltransferase [Thermodesulfobacteriota bacterium]
MSKSIRIGALISGGGTNLQAIIDSCDAGNIQGKVVFVGSDNPEARGLEKARKHWADCFVVDYAEIFQGFKKNPTGFKLPPDFNADEIISKQHLFPAGTDTQKLKAFFASRAIAEAKLLHEIQSREFDLLILAGFMRILTPYFIDRVNLDPGLPRIMNIHPALLPAFPGTDGYGDTFRYGCKVGGCTVHFVDYGEDSGPIIGQKAYDIYPQDTLDSIKKRGLALEWELYPKCIRLFQQGRLQTAKIKHTRANGQETTKTVVKILPLKRP